MIEALRTPDERFADLPGYAFTPHYAEVGDGLRMHYVDEGSGPVVLLMHGEPSWSYLYRTMVPVLVDAGLRVIAPDLIGFGRSDKPVAQDDYTYARHVAWIRCLVEQLDLQDVTFFGQDWGGLVGLRVVAENQDRFARVAIGNTGLPTGDEGVTPAFLEWLTFSQTTPDFAAGTIISFAVVNPMTPEIIAAYDAPFPDDSYKAGARCFPRLVPISPEDPAAPAQRVAREAYAAWTKPFLTLFSDKDPITRGANAWFEKHVPGAAGQPHAVVQNAGHFLQEDEGPQIARHLIAFITG